MLDFIPPQLWIVLALTAAGFGPATYVWQHVAQEFIKRDITQPPPDLSWRSSKQLHRSLAILAGLIAAGLCVFTPQAEEFARSDAFGPVVLGAIGSYALGTVVPGWRNRRIEPLLRGFSQTYERDGQPIRYWVSLGWNAILGCILFAGSLGVLHENLTPRCDDPDDEEALVEALQTCDTMLAENGLGDGQRADLFGARGRVHHRLGDNERALADYSEALKLDPDDSYALYNRAVIYVLMRNLWPAIEDFSASLALRPDNDEAYLKRGNAYLDIGNLEAAIKDFTTLYQRDPNHPFALANRGVAYAWLNNGDLAERDFAAVKPGDTGWPVVLHGRAVLARHRQDREAMLDYLSQAIAVDPNDLFALRMRADAYWEMGERELARNDDDRAMELEQQRLPPILVVEVR